MSNIDQGLGDARPNDTNATSRTDASAATINAGTEASTIFLDPGEPLPVDPITHIPVNAAAISLGGAALTGAANAAASTPDNPITINANPQIEYIKITVRAVLFLLTGVGLLPRILTPAQIAFLKSDEAVQAMFVVGGIASLAWAFIESKLHKSQAVAAAVAPNGNTQVVSLSVVSQAVSLFSGLFGKSK